MNFEGRILKPEFQEKSLMVDAEPHIMSRLRKMFDNCNNAYERGKYTHKPILFPVTLSACRDLIWLMDRYCFEVSDDILSTITNKANEYDNIVNSVSNADKDSNYRISKDALPLALPLRKHQVEFNNMHSSVKKMLLADYLGLGKTSSAISTLCEPERRPALLVVPPTLCSQWEREIKRFLPGASTHVIRGFKNYDLPKVDVLITSYNRLAPWQDVLLDGKNFKSLIFDEVHELRHTGTGKREVAKDISETVEYCTGLSATPIFNQGDEIWSVLDVIKPDCLGEEEDFKSEWCDWSGRVFEPATLSSFLKKQGLFLRRTPEAAGLNFGESSKHVISIDADMEKLKEVQNVAKLLALTVLSGNVGDDSDAARQFDWKLREATGVAKSRPASEFIKMLLESEEKVLVACWHREVYDILLKELAAYNPVMFTGSESPKEKDESVKRFIEGDSRVFFMSLRSGAGVDGLQKVCNTAVFVELDWSNMPMDQVLGRLARDGQTKHVNSYYITIADGSDPHVLSLLGIKRSQHEGLIEGKQSEGSLIVQSDASKDRVRNMAKAYLESIGEEIPVAVPEEGLLGDLCTLLRKTKLPVNTEEEMQEALGKILDENVKNAKVEREFKITKRSRLDFLVSDGTSKIAIELKIDNTKRTEVYRQVRRYVEEGGITALILVAPWYGIPAFLVDGVPVIVVDTNINQI